MSENVSSGIGARAAWAASIFVFVVGVWVDSKTSLSADNRHLGINISKVEEAAEGCLPEALAAISITYPDVIETSVIPSDIADFFLGQHSVVTQRDCRSHTRDYGLIPERILLYVRFNHTGDGPAIACLWG